MIRSLSVVESLWFFSSVCLPSCFLFPLSSLSVLKGLFLLVPPPPSTPPSRMAFWSVCLCSWSGILQSPWEHFFLFFNLERHWVWVDVAEWELPPPPTQTHTTFTVLLVHTPDAGLDKNNVFHYRRRNWEICGGGIQCINVVTYNCVE